MAEPVGSGGEGVAVAGARTVASTGHASRHGPHGERSRESREPGRRRATTEAGRWVIMAIAGGLAVVLGAWKGGPWVRDYFSHVSTDDAFVAGDATTVASRLADVVEQVLVHNDDYVERGTILVRLDRQPFQIAVDQMRSDLQQAKLNVDRMVKSLETARAGLDQARDQVQSSVAALEEAWRAVEGQQEQVRSRIAGLRSQAASLRASYAELVLAQKDHERVKNLVASQTATREELDQKLAAFESAREKFKVAEQSVQQARALLALAPDYQHPEQIPADLDRTDTQVRRAVAAGQQILANLGLASGMHTMEPEALHAALIRLTNNTSESWFDAVPAVRSARTQVDQTIAMLGGPSFDPVRPYEHPSVVRARKDLDEAELQLSYTEIRAPVSGFVNRRSVNPGDHVQGGPGLAVHPAARRGLHRGELQGNASGRPDDRPAGGDLGRCLSRAGRARPGLRVRPGDRRRLVDAAAGKRHRQLRQGRPAHPGADRPGRAQPARGPASGRDVGRPRGRHQGSAGRSGCR